MTDFAEKYARAVDLHQAGDLDTAERLYQELLQSFPDSPDVWHMFGLLQYHRGQTFAAIGWMRRAQQRLPEHPFLLSNLGAVLAAQNMLSDAEQCFRQAIALEPLNLDAATNLERLLRGQGRLDEVQSLLEDFCRRAPDNAPLWFQLGNFNLERHRYLDARRCLQRAVELDPRTALYWNALGVAHEELRDPSAAESCYRRALANDPNFAPACSNLARWYQQQGRLDDAAEWFDRCVTLAPNDPVLASNRLVFLHYLPQMNHETLVAEHRRWGERFAASRGVAWRRRTLDIRGDRPLRIGYLSPDFCAHAVASFALSLFQFFDRNQYQLFAYSNIARPDGTTAQLRQLATQWHDVWGWNDERVVQQIVADEIDILVDLSGHTSHHRLTVFAHRPAPLQITYLGYSTTTGVPTIDFRISDAICDPPGEAWLGSETLVQMPPPFATYHPWAHAPTPIAPPCLERGYVTFGSLHRLAKINTQVLDAWARVLLRVPSARLLMYRDNVHDLAQAWFREQFARRGIDPQRVDMWHELPGRLPYLHAYEHIDISLDAFPWSGHTTACEALWMGVPVVTLTGNRASGRMVTSVLDVIGCRPWAAANIEEYVEIAAQLAAAPEELRVARQQLRTRCMQSPLCDGRSFVQRLEHVYRSLWQHQTQVIRAAVS